MIMSNLLLTSTLSVVSYALEILPPNVIEDCHRDNLGKVFIERSISTGFEPTLNFCMQNSTNSQPNSYSFDTKRIYPTYTSHPITDLGVSVFTVYDEDIGVKKEELLVTRYRGPNFQEFCTIDFNSDVQSVLGCAETFRGDGSKLAKIKDNTLYFTFNHSTYDAPIHKLPDYQDLYISNDQILDLLPGLMHSTQYSILSILAQRLRYSLDDQLNYIKKVEALSSNNIITVELLHSFISITRNPLIFEIAREYLESESPLQVRDGYELVSWAREMQPEFVDIFVKFYPEAFNNVFASSLLTRIDRDFADLTDTDKVKIKKVIEEHPGRHWGLSVYDLI